MFIAGIEFFFGLVAGLILLIFGIAMIPKIGTSAVQFCKGQASTFATVLWSLVVVGGISALIAAIGAFQH